MGNKSRKQKVAKEANPHVQIFEQVGKTNYQHLSIGSSSSVGILTSNAEIASNVQQMILKSNPILHVQIHSIAAISTDNSTTPMNSVVPPTLQDIEHHHLIIVDTCFNAVYNVNTIGDLLASYVELGGKNLIIGLYSNCMRTGYETQTIQGRFLKNAYHPLEYTNVVEYPDSTPMGTVHVPQHPIMKQVSIFKGGQYSCRAISKPSAQACVIAEWQDKTPLLIEKWIPQYTCRIVCMNYNTGSNKSIYFSWDETSTHGVMILNNTVQYLLASSIPIFKAVPNRFCYQDVQFEFE